MRIFLAFSCLCGLGFTGTAEAQADFYLHDGDTVVFYGGSITNQRLYTVFTEAYVLTRFPGLKIRFLHKGWGGDRVFGGYDGSIDERLKRDVFAYKPSVITIMLGMNDGEYRAFDPILFGRYSAGYRHIIDRIKSEAPGARVTLLEPSPYDDVTRPPAFEDGYNSVLLRYGEFVRKLAKSAGLTDANLNAPVVDLLRRASELAPQEARSLISDRVHPSDGVHLVMAGALLHAWNAPATVTNVEIDAATGSVTLAQNTKIDALRATDGLSWIQQDAALPWPIESTPMSDLALRCSNLTESLNRELLAVRGLPAGEYRLTIDGEKIGSYNALRLANGINLATIQTPMSRQAMTVLDLTYRHNNLHFARWGMVDTALAPYNLQNTAAADAALDALENEVIALQRATAAPKPHIYRLTKE